MKEDFPALLGADVESMNVYGQTQSGFNSSHGPFAQVSLKSAKVSQEDINVSIQAELHV
jgi:hypothetical protein